MIIRIKVVLIMMKLSNIIKNILGTLSLLIFNVVMVILIINSDQLFAQFILLEFLICGMCFLISKIFVFVGNMKFANFFNKLGALFFLVYVLIFINIWCYEVIKEKGYALLLFAIPFYIIVLRFIKIVIVGKNKKEPFFRKFVSNLDFAKICINIFCILCIIGGIIMLSISTVTIFDYSNKISNYVETKGYFSDYSTYSDSTYTLIYSYYVNNSEYNVSTTYGTSMIPKHDTIRTVKYNPDNPEEAVIVGGESYIFMMFMGILFIVVPSIIMARDSLVFLSYNNKYLKLIIGLIVIILGIVPLYLITGSFSIIKLIIDYPISYLPQNIVIIFLLVVGIILSIESIIKLIKNK